VQFLIKSGIQQMQESRGRHLRQAFCELIAWIRRPRVRGQRPWMANCMGIRMIMAQTSRQTVAKCMLCASFSPKEQARKKDEDGKVSWWQNHAREFVSFVLK